MSEIFPDPVPNDAETHGRFPLFEGLDEDGDGRDMTVLLRIHGGIVERGSVLDERGEGVRKAEVDDRFRVGLDDCAEGGNSGPEFGVGRDG